MLAGAVEKSALAQPGFLVQTVRIPAVLVHCHWPFSITLVNGLGRVNSTEANAAAPARATARWRGEQPFGSKKCSSASPLMAVRRE
jgi:hypothetical protein